MVFNNAVIGFSTHTIIIKFIPLKGDLSLQQQTDRTCAIDYLRTSMTVLVLLLHSMLAYPTWGRLEPSYYLISTAPIIDPIKWNGFDLPPTLINNFFMALMFFISGLFVWKSIAKKGPAHFLKDRGLRLGIPFSISLVVIMPLAYYPSFLMTGSKEDFFTFWMGWSWNSGPAWFISLLLVFNLIAVGCFGCFSKSSSALPAVVFTRSSVFFLALLALSLAGLIPLLYLFGPFQWIYLNQLIIGQASKLALYLVYFLAGVAVGAHGIENSIFTPDGPLSRNWFYWVIASVFSTLFLIISLAAMHLNATDPWKPSTGWLQLGVSITLYSATLSLTFMAIFLRFVNTRNALIDSLSNHAYGIYLVHYPFVTWSQYEMLDSTIHPALKAFIVFCLSLGLSWATTALLRSIPTVRKII